MSDKTDREKSENYERIIREILSAFDNIDFHIIIESLLQRKLIPFDRDSKEDKLLLEDLVNIIDSFALKYKDNPITFNLYRKLTNPQNPRAFRNNEVGVFADKLLPAELSSLKGEGKIKCIEEFKRLSLNGYPDEVITDSFGRTTYLEIKATTRRNIGSPRDFFFSPLKNSKRKITADARHLLLGFDTYEVKRGRFVITGWCLIDLHDVKVSLKPEFNTDNLGLYQNEHIIFEKNFRKPAAK